MLVDYDITKINNMLCDFYKVTGINVDLLKEDFSRVCNKSFWEEKGYCKAIQTTKDGRKACLCSDECLLRRSKESKKAEMHVCHAGLIDISLPLLYNDVVIGYIILGQIKTDKDFSAFREYILSLGLSYDETEALYKELPSFDEEKIQSVLHLAEMIAKHILLENMLKLDVNENIQKAIFFINDNLSEPLSIEKISRSINVSKSVLYRCFHNYFGCTVSGYITKKRIEKAVELLNNTNLSIEEIAIETGFSDGSYFSKMFKKEKGISPLKFKKQSYL